MEKKTFSVKAEINVKLTEQDIDDIMVAALEGGINYWCGEAEVIEEKRVAIGAMSRSQGTASSSSTTSRTRTRLGS